MLNRINKIINSNLTLVASLNRNNTMKNIEVSVTDIAFAKIRDLDSSNSIGSNLETIINAWCLTQDTPTQIYVNGYRGKASKARDNHHA